MIQISSVLLSVLLLMLEKKKGGVGWRKDAVPISATQKLCDLGEVFLISLSLFFFVLCPPLRDSENLVRFLKANEKYRCYIALCSSKGLI